MLLSRSLRQPTTTIRRTNQAWLLIAGVVALALFLRWPQMNESLWLDELHTSWTVGESWQEIYRRAEIGNHSPLYFFLPKLAKELLGFRETTVRLPSLIA